MLVYSMSKAFQLLNYPFKFTQNSFTLLVLVFLFTDIIMLMFHCDFTALHFRGLQWGHQKELKIFLTKVIGAKWLSFDVLLTMWIDQFHTCVIYSGSCSEEAGASWADQGHLEKYGGCMLTKLIFKSILTMWLSSFNFSFFFCCFQSFKNK